MHFSKFKRYYHWLTALTLMFFCVSHVQADSTSDKIKEALEKYLNKKIEEKTGTSSQAAKVPEVVSIKFSGAEAVAPESLTPLFDTDAAAPTTPIVTNLDTNQENECYNFVQGKIAWDQNNNKNWSDNNVKLLCKNTTSAQEPGKCFDYLIRMGADWGKTDAHHFTWAEGVSLCAGTNNSTKSTQCFKNKIREGKTVAAAIDDCAYAVKQRVNLTVTPVLAIAPTFFIQPRIAQINQEEACIDYVQGKIAWEASGRQKTWATQNIKQLCNAAQSASAPGECFKYVLFSGDQWGKKATDQITWKEGIDLCEGASDLTAIKMCFKTAVTSGKSVADAIKQCEKN